MKKLSFIFLILWSSWGQADLSNNQSYIFDSIGNMLLSTSNALNAFITNSTLAVTQSGTWTVQQGTPPWSVVGNVASGSSDSGNPVKIGAVYNSTLPTLSTGQRVDAQSDLNGRRLVTNAPLDGYKSTYGAAIQGLAAAAAPTDIITISGSSTKTVRITHIDFGNTQNVATSNSVFFILRSTADTGGTSSTVTSVPYDSNSAAATAVVKQYTVNPTLLGTAVGTLKTYKIFGSTSTTAAETVSMDFGNRPAQAVVLRGTSQFLVVNLNAQAFVGSSIDVNIEWTEE